MTTQCRDKPTSPDLAQVQAVLERDFPDRRWLKVLEVCLPTGVADAGQLRRAVGLSPDQLETLAAHFQALDGDRILSRLPFNVPRPGARGRPPAVYALGETGAALLRRNAHRTARACGLTDAPAIAHALATLDVRLAALQAGLDVQTERELPYSDGQTLRPDNQVVLADGTRALFETEQAADVTLLRRIAESVRHKAAFFSSDAGRRFSPTVRVLVNLPRGREWERTASVWERATAIVAQEHGGRLPFDLLALPLAEFLAHPDWEEPPDAGRWESLYDPAQSPAFGLTPAEAAPAAARGHAPQSRAPALPEPLRRCSAHDDRLILLAYWQVFQEQSGAIGGNRSRPDPAFFELMRLIYAASHDPDADPLTRAAVPRASLYLLRQYLLMHPDLHQALSKAITRGASSIRWSVPTILHKMEVVIAEFLRYHGFQMGGPLAVHPDLGRDGRAFEVVVSIRAPELLMAPGYGIVPGREAVRQAEEALAWVLWALFAYAGDLGLKRAVFW